MKEGILSKEEINELLGNMDNPWGKAEIIKDNESKKKRVSDARIDAENMMARIRVERAIKKDDLDRALSEIKGSIYNLDHDFFFLYSREIMRQIKEGLTESDLDIIKKALDTVIILRNKGKLDGLMNLAEMVKSLDAQDCPLPIFIKELVLLITDGTAPDLIKEIGLNMVYVNDFKGVEALVSLIYIYGAMLVQSGGIVWQYLVYIRSFIPMELRAAMKEYIDTKIDEELEGLK